MSDMPPHVFKNPASVSMSRFLVSAALPIEYGLTDSLEVDIAFSWVDWFATQQNFDPDSTRNANGLAIPPYS